MRALRSKVSNTDSLDSIVSLHRRGSGGIRTAALLTNRLDSLIRKIYDDLDYPPKQNVALLALGGYGRRELCFGSDTDVMFLVPPDQRKAEAGFAVQKLLYALLDLGLDIGHSVRTVGDCLSLHKSDTESWVSVLESRFICGNRPLSASLRELLQSEIGRTDRSGFVQDILNRLDLRHQKHGDSSKLLEPNAKNSAGGLRDFHTALWLSLGTGLFKIPRYYKGESTGLTSFLQSPVLRKAIDTPSARKAYQALDFILRTRNEMHLQGKGLHDTLEFNLQGHVATALGYKKSRTRSNVERFMQDYFLATRQVAQLTQRVAGMIQQTFHPAPRNGAVKRLDRWFSLREKSLHFIPRHLRLSNEILLTAFLHSLRHQASFSHQLEDAIGRQLKNLAQLRSAAETALFRELLAEPSGVALTLQRLNELDVLSRWIPEWKEMVAFFQHNQYHYYTADEHTIRVVANAEALGQASHPLSQVFRGLPRRDILYLACLLHDIAKPRRVRDHEITGSRIAEKVLRRLGFSDVLRDVSFLIRHHLAMEQMAFRRNLSDPQTVIKFASMFRTPLQLDYLYVLTYADLSAVNKTVWTEWKGMLLNELYHKSKEILERKLSEEEVHRKARSHHKAAVRELVETLSGTIPGETSRTHLLGIETPAYLATFSSEEVAEHIRHIEKDEPVAASFKHFSKHTEITIIARDAPFMLSRFCGVLSANDANIFDAHVFTRNDGIIIDKFRVTDFISHAFLSDHQCQKIHQDLHDVVRGVANIDDLLLRHRMKWRRRTRSANPNVRLDVLFEEHPQYTIIDLFAADMLGFLYKTTESMSRLGLNIYFAKIATRADGIVDSFYVLDREGKKITSDEQKEALRAGLLATMKELSQTELILT